MRRRGEPTSKVPNQTPVSIVIPLTSLFFSRDRFNRATLRCPQWVSSSSHGLRPDQNRYHARQYLAFRILGNRRVGHKARNLSLPLGRETLCKAPPRRQPRSTCPKDWARYSGGG